MAKPGELEVGTSVGRYVLLRREAEHLFVAYDPELDRNVALKLLSVRDGDPGIERDRLVQEAQSLARLAHPNVVVVYDVGTWTDRVYMAMEYVEGETLGAWLEAKPRTWAEVREVIIGAGEGLAAAHAAEIVHLDVNPAKIIVATDGIVRVLEFGLARRLRTSVSMDTSGDGISDSGRTGSIAVTGTPDYVAAECYRGEDVDARADQFALCVTAWEAFFGQRPFRGETRRAVKKAILLGRIDDAPSSSVPQWIEAALRRGLHPNPHERWPDIPALLRVLRRDPARHRTRNIAIVAGTLTLGLGTWAYLQAASSRRALCQGGEAKFEGIWDDVTQAAVQSAIEGTGVDYADATWGQLRAVLDGYAASWVQMYTDACEATRLRGEQSDSLLDRRMACLEERRQEVDALVRVLRGADERVAKEAVGAASGLASISPCADAEHLMKRAAPANEAQREQLDRLRKRRAEARALERSGRPVAAQEAAEEALALALELGVEAEESAVRLILSSVAERRGDFPTALEHGNKAVWAAERAAADVERMHAYTQIAWTIGHVYGAPERGHEFVRLGLGVARRLGNDPMHRARLLAAKAVLFFDEGKYRESIVLGHQMIELLASTGVEQPELAASYNNIAASHQSLGELAQALDFYERARTFQVQRLGAAHPEVAEIVANAASVKHRVGQLEEAHADFRSALGILESSPGQSEVVMRNLHNNFGSLLQDLGRHDDAVAFFQRAVDSWKKVNERDPLVGVGLCNIADVELDRGRPEAALDYARDGFALIEDGLAPDHQFVAYAATVRGRVALALGNAEEALPLLRRGHTMLGNGADASLIAQAQLALAETLLATNGDLNEATTLATAAQHYYSDMKKRKQARDAKAVLAKIQQAREALTAP